MSFTKETLAHLWSKITNLVDTKLQKPKNDIALNTSSIGMSKKNLLNTLGYISTLSNSANNGTITKGIDYFTLTATSNDCFSYPTLTIQNAYEIPVKPNTKYILSWTADSDTAGRVYVFSNGVNSGTSSYWTVDNKNTKQLTFTTKNDTTYITLRFGVLNSGTSITYSKIMLRYADIADSTYEPYIDDLQTQITKNDNDIAITQSSVGLRKKNLLQPASTLTRAGITYTVNTDGSVSLTGKSTATGTYNYFSIPFTFKAGKYKVNGMPEGSSNSTYRVDIRANESGGTPYGYGFSEFEVEFTETTTAYYMIYVTASYTESLDGVTFYPMIRYADITDDTYEPYTHDLQTQVSINQSSIGLSRKNLLNPKTVEISPSSVTGITFTTNSDGTISASGTATANAFYKIKNMKFETGKSYILNGCPIGGSSSTYFMAIDGVSTSQFDIGKGSTVYIPDSDVTKQVIICINAGTTVASGTCVFKPMIRYSDIADNTYEPYVDDLQTQIAKNDNDIAITQSSIGLSKKNLLKVTNATQKIDNVTFTVNDDMSITVSGKNTSDATVFYRITNSVSLPIGKTYKLSGCPTNNKDADGKTMAYWRVEKQALVVAMDTGDSKTFTTTTSTNPTMAQICVYAGADFTDNPITFYPMIRYADITDDTYETYTPSLQEQINDIVARLTAGGL